MLRTSAGPQAKPDIERAIQSIIKENAAFDRTENRSSLRENLVRAVDIVTRDQESPIDAFSRNVSATGIGLITRTELPKTQFVLWRSRICPVLQQKSLPNVGGAKSTVNRGSFQDGYSSTSNDSDD